MIKNWFVTGDTHGHVMERLNQLPPHCEPNETALIILGDAGINFYLNKTDNKNKKILNAVGITIYCVRGNHEERPENLSDIESFYDENVKGEVWYQSQYPLIRYFKDGGEYEINGHSILTIGGAYSVDKWYRLSRMPADASWTGWFKDEQLTPEEMVIIEVEHASKHFDFIFTHTGPESWEPRDLFLAGLDQSTVDKTMEKWFDSFKNMIDWNVWLFGHYHDDRLIRPGVEMYFNDIEELSAIWERWQHPDRLDWWLKKDPNYDGGL